MAMMDLTEALNSPLWSSIGLYNLLIYNMKTEGGNFEEEVVAQYEPGTFPPFDFSLFSYMKIHQRQHIRFPRPLLN